MLGIWPEQSDSTCCTAVAISSLKDFLVAVDDFGKVNFFKYPCIVKNALCKTYSAHGPHAANVVWSASDAQVVTVGGADQAMMQWTPVCV